MGNISVRVSLALLVVLAIVPFRHALAAPWTPSPAAIISPIASVSSAPAWQSCTEGAGDVHKVSVCPGEDWWLPDAVGKSDHGHVISRNFPIDCWQNENVSMIESSAAWQEVLDTDKNETVESSESAAIDNARFDKVMDDRYLVAAGKSYEKKIHLVAFGGSDEGLGPDYLANLNVPLLRTYIDAWLGALDASDPAAATKARAYVDGDADRDGWWDTVENYHGSDTDLIYTFWDENFLTEREKYIDIMGNYLATHQDGSGNAVKDLVEQVNLNSENCLIASYLKSGLWTTTELDTHVEELLNTAALDSTTPPIDAADWLVNVCTGGRSHLAYAEFASTYGTGMGTHGTSLSFNIPYQALFDNTYYDTDLKAFRPTGRAPYSFIHTDETHIIQNDNTWGNYRMFRNILTAAISMDVNRILIDAAAIISEGRYIKEGVCKDPDDAGDGENWDSVYDATGNFEGSCYIGGYVDADSDGITDVTCDNDASIYECVEGNDAYFCNFRWDEIKDEGALEFVRWMGQVAGLPAEESPEAYVSLAQMGNATPNGVDESAFRSALDTCFNLEDWGETDNASTCYWYSYYKTPLLSYFGRYADLDQTIAGGTGTPALLLDSDRLRGETVPDPAEWSFGGELVTDADGTYVDANGDGSSDRESVFYEGKRTDHPATLTVNDDTTVTVTKDENGSPAIAPKHDLALYFKLQDDFVRPGTSIPEIPRQNYGSHDLAVYGSIKDVYTGFDKALPDADEPKSDFSIKIFYENDTERDGTWRLDYDGVNGWTEAPAVTVKATDTGIRTATFRLNDAMFANRGTGGADFSIRSVSGYSASFLHVRIIKLDKSDYDDDTDGLANSIDPQANEPNAWGYIDKDKSKLSCLEEKWINKYGYAKGKKRATTAAISSVMVNGVKDATKAVATYRCGGESAPAGLDYGIYVVSKKAAPGP